MTMITSLPYLLEVQVCFVLLWAVYHAVIGRGGDFAASRVYLLSVPVLSLVIPLLDVPVFVRYVYLGPAARLADRLTEFSPIAEEAARSTPVLTDIVIAAAALGTMFFLVRFLVSLTAIRRMSHGVRKVTRNSISLYDSDSCPSPCSFFRKIYVNTKEMAPGYLDQIVAHEMAHIELGHSYDRVFAGLVHMLLWWNPAVWLWRRSLVEVHEYQVDRRVLNGGCEKAQYVNAIVRELTDIHPGFVSGFSYSLIKKRLTMISKRTSGRFSKLRVLTALPAVGIALLLFSFTTRTEYREIATVGYDVQEEQVSEADVLPAESPDKIQVKESVFHGDPQNQDIQAINEEALIKAMNDASAQLESVRAGMNSDLDRTRQEMISSAASAEQVAEMVADLERMRQDMNAEIDEAHKEIAREFERAQAEMNEDYQKMIRELDQVPTADIVAAGQPPSKAASDFYYVDLSDSTKHAQAVQSGTVKIVTTWSGTPADFYYVDLGDSTKHTQAVQVKTVKAVPAGSAASDKQPKQVNEIYEVVSYGNAAQQAGTAKTVTVKTSANEYLEVTRDNNAAQQDVKINVEVSDSVQKQMEYPAEAKEKKRDETIMVSFIWTPRTQNGKPQTVNMTVPMHFADTE